MRITSTLRCVFTVAGLFCLALGPARSASAGKMVYLSLGDSVAFGETNFTNNPSNGDRGYVSAYANYLAFNNGGVRPQVVNLAVDGETSSSFSTGVGRVGPTANYTDSQLAALNTNYGTGANQPTQQSLMLGTIAAEKAAGNTISNVTVSLGANDLFALATKPGFLTESAAAQQADLTKALGTFQQNYTGLLTQLKQLAPDAHISLLGSYNPFPGAPSSPFAQVAGPAIQALNQVIAGEAKAFGVDYVDTASAIAGHETAYTYITSGNVHPNAAGYAWIAGQVEAVPEPSTVAIYAVGGLVLVGLRRRMRAAAQV
jgi:lysophospholipase L1-like esterase